jgi:uncharacterized membrane protein
MRAMVMGSAIGILMLVALAWPSPARADFTVCNHTSSKVGVAVGYVNPHVGGFVTEGWFNLTPGQCRMLVPSSATSDPHNYFYFARGGGLLWEGDVPFCIINKYAFELTQQPDDCTAGHSTGDRRGFYRVSSQTGNITQHLTGGSGQIID